MVDLARQHKAMTPPPTIEVVRMSEDDSIHDAALCNILPEALSLEAEGFGITLTSDGINNVLGAIHDNKIQALFLLVSTRSLPKKIAGATIQFPTVIVERTPNGFSYLQATYVEDFCLLNGSSAAYREQTQSTAYPRGLSLAAAFELERIRIEATNAFGTHPFGLVSNALVLEHSPDNERVIGLLKKIGATLETNPDSNVLEFKDLPLNWGKRNQQKACLEHLGTTSPDNNNLVVVQKNFFATSWTSPDGKQKVSATFTDAMSTFEGKGNIRVQLTSNGQVVQGEELENAIVSLFARGHKEIMRRKWIPKNVLASGKHPLSFFLFHAAPREPVLTATLRKIGAESRELGTKAMKPAIVRFSDVPKDLLGIKLQAPTPFIIIRPETGVSTSTRRVNSGNVKPYAALARCGTVCL